MELQGYFSIKRPDIVHETIEGEAVIVNLESGVYYSLRDSGVDVWNLIEAGANFDELIGYLNEHYEGSTEEMKNSLVDLLVILQKEGLVKVSSSKPDAKKRSPSTAKVDKIKFSPPLLEKFSDLQELLLLDPIHEIDEEGWPHKIKDDKAGNPG